jgi:uncharacterized protein (PEP-CTERM system associated)
MWLTDMSMATDTSPYSVSRDWSYAIRMAIAMLGASCAGIADAGSWTIVPAATLGETYSSNMALTAVSEQRGLITDVAPSIRVDGVGARGRMHLDYRRDYLYYEGNSSWNRHENLLNSFSTLEAIDNWLFLDASANIVQRNLSVFGPVAVGGSNATANQVETTTVQASPYIRGRLLNIADYLVRFNSVDSRSDDPSFANTRVDQLVASVKNEATTGFIGWFADGTDTNAKNDLIGTRDDARFRVGVMLPIGSHVRLSAFGGRERTDFASDSKQTTSTPGAGVEWSPSKQLQVAALGEKRFFGNGHNLLVSYRTPMTAWRYSDVKDVQILPTLLAGYDPGAIGTLMSDLLESSIPDPLERSRTVRARLESAGTMADLPGGGGAQVSRFYIDHVQEASAAILLPRNTVTLLLRQEDQKLISFAPGVVDVFTGTGESELRQRGGSLVWVHRLTPITNFSAAASRLKSSGVSDSGLEATQDTLTATVSVRLSPKANASVGLRTTKLDSTDPKFGLIRENALVGSLTQRF